MDLIIGIHQSARVLVRRGCVFDTTRESLKVQLDGKGAPIHVANFCELAESGFYDDTKFHRLVPGFVLQGGDPNTREMSVEDVVFGLVLTDSWYRWSWLSHQRGVLQI